MKNKVLKIFLIVGAALVFIKGGVAVYRFYEQAADDVPQEADEVRAEQAVKMLSVKRTKDEFGYGFGRMIPLIQACEKVVSLERLRFATASDGVAVDSQTIRDLIKSLAQERMKFRRYVDMLKDRAREPITTKKMRSLLYYLRVLEDSMQDLEIVLANRILPAQEQHANKKR